MQQLDDFIREIIEAKKLPGVTDEIKQDLIVELRGQLVDQINHALINALSEEQLEVFNDAMDQEGVDDAATEKILRDAGVDIEKVTALTMVRFRDLYLRDAGQRSEVEG